MCSPLGRAEGAVPSSRDVMLLEHDYGGIWIDTMYDWVPRYLWGLDWAWMGIGVQGVGFHRSTVLRSLGFAECSLARRWGVFFWRKLSCSLVHERLTDCCMTIIHSSCPEFERTNSLIKWNHLLKIIGIFKRIRSDSKYAA